MDTREKMLSIVVPAYNAEKFLRDNLDSFCIEKILGDIEVLIINDGSKDNTLEIAKEYEEKFPQTFRVFDKENGGHGSGINYGIRYAKGKYFKVVDADDWVEEEAFIRLVKALGKSDADIVYSGFYWVYDNGGKDIHSFTKKAEFLKPFEGVEYHKEYHFDDIAKDLYIKMHNMTIKTSILQDNGIVIDENAYYVDTEYILYPIPYVKTILFIEDFVYRYRIGNTGQSVDIKKMQKNEEQYDRVLESLFAFYDTLGFAVACSPEKKAYIASLIARIIAGKIKILLSYPISMKKQRDLKSLDKRLRTEYPEIYDRNQNTGVRLLRKTGYLLFVPMSMAVRRYYSKS